MPLHMLRRAPTRPLPSASSGLPVSADTSWRRITLPQVHPGQCSPKRGLQVWRVRAHSFSSPWSLAGAWPMRHLDRMGVTLPAPDEALVTYEGRKQCLGWKLTAGQPWECQCSECMQAWEPLGIPDAHCTARAVLVTGWCLGQGSATEASQRCAWTTLLTFLLPLQLLHCRPADSHARGRGQGARRPQDVHPAAG